MARRIALTVGIALLVACGGGQEKPETPDTDTSEWDPMDEEMQTPVESSEKAEPESHTGGPVSEFGDRPPPVPEAWELSQRDCDDLGRKYEELLLIVEMEKLEKRNMQAKLRPAAEQNVRKTAQQGAKNWMQACQEIVGSIQSKPRWECAYKASTLDRFTGCLDGKFESETE